jgi:N-acetylmuramoyl-L-alanine amidase
LNATRKFAAVILAVLAGAAAVVYSVRAQPQGQIPMPAQQPSSPTAPAMNHNLVILDPAHGGPDPGATIGDHALEKDITLAFALKLRAALAAANFTVATTRDADVSDPLTTDARAEVANRTHAVACIVLHATSTGSGVHVYTSTLPPSPPDEVADPTQFVPIPWDTAQASFVTQSLRLASDVNAALGTANLPALLGRAPLRPLDNLMCPAIAIEIAPLQVPGSDATPVTDGDYQQRTVAALSSALQVWRSHADPGAPPMPATQATAQSRAIAAAEAAGLAATRANLAAQTRSNAQKGTP